mmetsp:Transcript_43134/g.93851  ORF Transcript_43134/g.93851 Transcript_43134/m.93851 type:complete len:165 (+) Transcript_43134:83-577(+)
MQISRVALLLALLAPAAALRASTAPEKEISEEVKIESQENLHISDGFASQEQQDDNTVKVLKANKDLSALELAKAPAVKDPCGSITCGALKCPAGFKETTLEGHCCPYCVNPNIKVEAAVTGATGSSGGKASTFCPEVWCFPTMCAKAISNPTGSNGQCCPMCS